MLSGTMRRRLLEIARRAIAARLGNVDVPMPMDEALPEAAGVFVTLRSDAALRGCIGSLDVSRSLVDLVAHCAVAASFEDPRFPPLREEELACLKLEISVLTPPELVLDPADIEVGRHGLIVEQGPRRGLLLPQVPLEWNWDRQTFLAQTCLKAGLPPDAWQWGATLMRFEAEVFGEGDSTAHPSGS